LRGNTFSLWQEFNLNITALNLKLRRVEFWEMDLKCMGLRRILPMGGIDRRADRCC
jgi:hypothetical protein